MKSFEEYPHDPERGQDIVSTWFIIDYDAGNFQWRSLFDISLSDKITIPWFFDAL